MINQRNHPKVQEIIMMSRMNKITIKMAKMSKKTRMKTKIMNRIIPMVVNRTVRARMGNRSTMMMVMKITDNREDRKNKGKDRMNGPMTMNRNHFNSPKLPNQPIMVAQKFSHSVGLEVMNIKFVMM